MKGREITSPSQRRFFCESEKFDVLYPFPDNCRQRFSKYEPTVDNIIAHFPTAGRLCSSMEELDRSRVPVLENLLLTSVEAPDGTLHNLAGARVFFELLIDDINHLSAFEITTYRRMRINPRTMPETVEFKTTCFKLSHEHIAQLVSATCVIAYTHHRLTVDLRDGSEQYLQKIAAMVKSRKEEEEIGVRNKGCCSIL